jgi:capsular polysaccharide biosynthesis protein
MLAVNSPQTGPEVMEPLTRKLGPIALSARMDEIRAAIRWLALLILPIIVSAISALVISQFIPPIYGARTDLILHLQQSGDAVERYLANQVVIIKSPAVLGPVSEKAGITAEQVDEQLSVQFPKSGSVMRIQYANQSREVALDLTRKILAQYELVISQSEIDENASHQVISPPALLEKPVWPQPLQMTAIGGAIGVVISLIALALVRTLRTEP